MMKTWQMLLRKIRAVGKEQYGPHTKEIGSMIIALQEAPWYANVGRPSPFDDKVVRVASIEDAWTILDNSERYAVDGLLIKPTALLEGIRAANEAENNLWREARKLVIDAVETEDPPLPPAWVGDGDREAFTHDYLYDTLDRLLEEIILSDLTTCTYFREQLQWLAAGYLPCGWEGE